MQLPRVTTRHWLIAIAGIAIGLGSWGMVRRRDYYRRCASKFEHQEKFAGTMLRAATEPTLCGYEGPSTGPKSTSVAESNERLIEELRQRILYFRQMKFKYETAARHPWLPVSPDPPEPRHVLDRFMAE